MRNQPETSSEVSSSCSGFVSYHARLVNPATADQAGLGLLFIRTSLHSWQQEGTPLSWKFGRLITGDVLVLAFADLLMVLGQFFCVPFVQGLISRRYRYHWAGVIIQHTYQTLYLGGAIWWGWARQWYWVQAGFLVLRE